VLGEKIEDFARYHEYDFHYSEKADGILPVPLAQEGLKGVFYRKYDLSMCTYCSAVNGIMLSAIRHAWQGTPWDGVEVLTGKSMQPTPGMQKTILIGKCMYKAHKESPAIRELIAVKGCPPQPRDLLNALRRAGIAADAGLFEKMDELPGLFMSRYAGRPEFEEGHFRIQNNARCGLSVQE
jgi:Ni,Fe-hydrogenase III small subunit